MSKSQDADQVLLKPLIGVRASGRVMIGEMTSQDLKDITRRVLLH
jgi:hypothetical protein